MARKPSKKSQDIPFGEGALIAEDGRRLPSPISFARGVMRGMSHDAAARYAGYAPSVDTTRLMKSLEVRQIFKSVEDARRELQTILGTDYSSVANAMADIVHGGAESADRDRIQAAKVLADMQGYNAPKEMNVTGQFLIAELGSVSSSSLSDILESAGIKMTEAEVV